MTVTINGSTGVTTPEVVLDNASADGGQVVLKSSGYSNWNWDNYSGRLRAYYGATEYFTVDSSGNVGIGTNNPSSWYGKIAVVGYLSSGGQNYSSAFSDGINSTIRIAHQSDLTNLIADHQLALYSASAEAMRLDSNRRVYVNQTAGNGNTAQRMGLTYDGSIEWGLSFKNSWSGNGGSAVNFNNYAGTQVGTIQPGASSTAYVTTSDYRLKENVQPMQNALETVSKLNPVTYTWKSDGVASQGFIAHELQAVVPDAAFGEKDAVDAEGNPVYQGIDTSFLVATLCKAIQELKAEVDALKGAK